MQRVELTQGKFALVDDTDMELVSQHRWRAQQLGQLWYAVRSTHTHQYLMHRMILGLVDSSHLITVDHINGDGLDNRRENLRVANKAQQIANSGSRAGTSRYKGVSYDARRNKWRMAIVVGGVQTSKSFSSEQDAARAYNTAAIQAWGEYAKLNDV